MKHMKTKYKLILTSILFLFGAVAFAQQTVTGTVTDETGAPLPGATIFIEGTSTSATTDFDGNYSILTSEGETLTFNFVGYETQQNLVTSSTMNVVLSSLQLEEVVVTGVAGPTDRRKLTVTVNKVTAEDLDLAPPSSAGSALQGKVAGVQVTNFGQPGAGATIQLRGATNLFGGQSPLLIVDGVIVGGGIADLNTDDIDSFEIVKGAAASALYGSTAGNGVIVVTTKRGSSKDGPSVTIKTDFGQSELSQRIDLNQSHVYDLATDWESFKGKFTAYDGVVYPTGYNGTGPVTSGARIESADGYHDNPYGVYYDNQDIFFQKGFNSRFYTSISNANENTNVFFSFDRTEQEGIFLETGGYERYGVRLNADYNINDWLKFSASNNFVRTNNETPGGTLDGVLFDLVLTPPDANVLANNPDGQPYYYLPNAWETINTNPLYDLYINKELSNRYRYLGNFNLNVKLTDDVSLDANYGIETTSYINDDYIPISSYNVLASADIGFGKTNGGSYSKESSTFTSKKAQFTLNYFKEFNDVNITAQLSYLLEDQHYEYFYGFGNQKQIYPGVRSLDNFNQENVYISSSHSDERATDVFAIVGVDIKDRYIFEGLFRNDQSSLFGSETRSNDYYRISGAYRISEDFDIQGIQEFKINAAYGTAGQRPGFSWQYDAIGLSNGSLSTNRVKASENLKPSTTTELEFGMNLDFLDRFKLEAVLSNAETEDQFMYVDIFSPANAGANKQWQNVGTVEFKTLELSLESELINNNDFNWDLGVRFTTTDNEIKSLNVDPILVGYGDYFRIEEGLAFGTMWGEDFLTSLSDMEKQLPAGETIDDYEINNEGFVVPAGSQGTSDEKAVARKNEDGSTWIGEIGDQNADFTMGISSTFSYKNFGLYMLWDIKQGGDVYNQLGQWLTRDSRSGIMDQAGKADSAKKHYNYYQGLYNTNKPTSFWIEDGSYTKLRELSLYYNFDDSQLANFANGFFDSLRVGITGTNLLTLTDYKGWDPEVQLYDSGTQNYFAVDYGVYPVSSKTTLSVQLKF